ncbi:MAG: hypothetical protein AAFV43_13570 [Planctomycetota bacterium]
MRRPTLSWKAAIYYGEVFGFVAAWVVGLTLLSQHTPDREPAGAWDRLASADEPADRPR